VKIKKGLSVVNQAIAMDKALTGEDLSQYSTAEQVYEMFKKRMSVTDSGYSSLVDSYALLLQDGLGLFIANFFDTENFRTSEDIGLGNNVFTMAFSTQQNDDILKMSNNLNECIENNGGNLGRPGHLCGDYIFYCGIDRCVPSEETAAILNSADPTKAE